MPDPTPDTDSSVYIHLSVPIGYSSLYDTSAIPKKSESFFVIDCNQIVVTSDAFTLSFPITECDKIPATKWAINFSFLLSCNNSSLHFSTNLLQTTNIQSFHTRYLFLLLEYLSRNKIADVQQNFLILFHIRNFNDVPLTIEYLIEVMAYEQRY